MLLLSVLMLKDINTPEINRFGFVNTWKTEQALKYVVTKPLFLLRRLAKI